MPEMPQTSPETASHPVLHPVARLLPPEEWAKVPALAMLRPESSFIVVVEDGGPGGTVLAAWAAMTVVHVEGLQLIEDARGHAGVNRALLTGMIQELNRQGVVEVLTQADSEDVAQMCEKAGGRVVPGTTWVIPLGARASQPQEGV